MCLNIGVQIFIAYRQVHQPEVVQEALADLKILSETDEILSKIEAVRRHTLHYRLRLIESCHKKIPEPVNPVFHFIYLHIFQTDFAEDWHLTCQEEACTRITRCSFFRLSPCRKWLFTSP